MKVIISERAYASILAETTEKIKTETGGLFLGVIDQDHWYIVEAIDPGPKSIFKVAYFEYDRAYTQHLINKIANLYDAKLSLIGLWHRHPGSFDQFSSTDDETNSKYASMRTEGAISALVNIDPTFRLTIYHVGQPCKYSIVDYEVGDCLIPEQYLQYKSPERFEKIMGNILHRAVKKSYESKLSLHHFVDCVYPYLERQEFDKDEHLNDKNDAERILDEIIEDVTYMTQKCGIALSISLNGCYICLSDENDHGTKLYFKHMTDSDSILFSLGNHCFNYKNHTLENAYEKYKVQQMEQKHAGEPEEQPSFFASAIKSVIKMTKKGDEE